MKTHNSFDEQFEFTGSVKTWSLIAIVIGVVAIAFGFLTGAIERTFANLLLMGYYFTCVCLCGVFFCAVQYVAQAGWSASILRIPHAFIKVLPIAATILVVIALAGLSFTHHGESHEGGHEVVQPYLYKIWAAEGVSVEGSANYDHIIAGKSSFLNVPFFSARLIGFLVCYTIFGLLFVKYSKNEDEVGGILRVHLSVIRAEMNVVRDHPKGGTRVQRAGRRVELERERIERNGAGVRRDVPHDVSPGAIEAPAIRQTGV